MSLERHKVWEIADLPPGKRTISAKWVFKAKRDDQGNIHTYKARLVARGFSQIQGRDYDKTFAPVVRHETVRILFAVVAMKNMHVRHVDVKTAYLNGKLDEELFLEPPPGFSQPTTGGKVLRLRRSLYGLKQSARVWNQVATDALQKLGFRPNRADPCLFSRSEKNNTMSYVLLYVDDLLIAGSSPELTCDVGKQLNSYFEIKDLGEVRQYLGMQVEREEDGSFLLYQAAKVRHLLKEHGLLDAKPVATPMEANFLSSTEEESPKLPDNAEYRKAIGSLLYLATATRPDISFAVGQLCRCMEHPTQRDWKAVKRVMRYLAGSPYRKLRFSANGSIKLSGFVDADWAGDQADRKSTSGYAFKVGTSTVAWSSRKQSFVALSSTEAEYIAASEACRDLLWIRQVLEDIGIEQVEPTIVYEDNQGCIKMAQSERHTRRTKHIDIRYHQLRELQESGIIALTYCPSNEMPADMLTKPLTKDKFVNCLQHLGLQ
uniref:Reverse transcriptase Ty1/copia-type domain-containing protein n=1 Tax=Trichuris muris TaxID=70415 RepID=A0A5S6QJX2_TRIMR